MAGLVAWYKQMKKNKINNNNSTVHAINNTLVLV